MKMEDCTVEENVQIAKDTYKMKIKGNFVKECRTPGQFVNIRIGDGREHVLRRPISISEIDRGEKFSFIINLLTWSNLVVVDNLGYIKVQLIVHNLQTYGHI